MIIFLYGQDSCRISQKLRELINGYKAKNPVGLNFFLLNFLESPVKDFEEKLINNSLIPEKKLIVVKNIFKADPREFIEILKSNNISKREDVILIIIHFGDSNSGDFFQYLIKKSNQSQNFKALKEYEVKNWIKKLLNSFAIELTSEAMDFLILNCGPDLWRLGLEIDKLASFKLKGVVSKSQIEELLVAGANYKIFELTDALAGKNKKRALEVLYKALENGGKPAELLGMLAWQIRNILQFKSDPESLELHPFVLSKIQKSAAFFSVSELSAILSKIIDLDLNFKTIDRNEKTSLSLLISEL